MYNLYEAYLDVYDDLGEGYKDLPTGRMATRAVNKARSWGETQQIVGNSNLTQDQKNAVKNAGDKSDKQASAIVRAITTHDPQKVRAKENSNRSTINVTASTVTGPELSAKKLKSAHEEYFDIILDYLLDEGYADTEEAAGKIMLVMSEEWIDNILNESDSAELAKLRVQMNDALRRGDNETVARIASRLSEIQTKKKAQIGAALNRDNPRPNTRPSGPQKPKDVVSGLSSPTLRTNLTNQATQMINRIPDNPQRPAKPSGHVNGSGEWTTNTSQDTFSGIDPSIHVKQTRAERRRPARQQTPRRGETGPDPSRPITTRNQTN